MAQAGGCLAGEQLCGKGLGGQGAGQEAAVCPGSKGGQQCPALCDQQHGQEMEGRDLPSLCGKFLVHIENAVSTFGNPKNGKVLTIWSGFSEGP